MRIRVGWKGADEFVDALKAVERHQPAFVRYEALTAANTIASDFRPKIPVLTGRALRSVKVRQVNDTVAVLSRGVNVDYWFWLEFGGTTGRGHKPRRGGGSVKRKYVGKLGYFYWRSLENKYPDIVEAAGQRLVTLLRRSRLEVTTYGDSQRR